MEPKHLVETTQDLEEILGTPAESQANKVIDHIDEHCRSWIERTPFIVISTVDGAGRMDVSPKGDPAGFVRVLDEKTLVIPDRPGNRRADTFRNLLENPNCAVIFIIPLRREVVRVSGTARISRDPALLASMAVEGRAPNLALVLTVNEAMFHCGKSIIRSNLWNPETWLPVDGLPTYAQALRSHANPSYSDAALEARIANSEQNRLY